MNTRQYYYLTTIAEYGNLTYAAEALNVTPSALSKFLTECGQIFGTTLFQRRDRRLEPTEEGQYVVECAQKILDQQNRMLLIMKNVTGSNRKRIRLATAPNRGAMIYSKIYKPFSRRYPDVSLELVELYATEQPGAIARGAVDLALGAGPFRMDTEDIPVAYEELLIHCRQRILGREGEYSAGRIARHAVCIAGDKTQHSDSGRPIVPGSRVSAGGCI